MNDKRLRVAVMQMCPGEDIQKNLKTAGELMAAAARDGAKLVVFQETFYYRGPHAPHDMKKVAESIPGPTSQWLSEQARAHGIWLHGGSIFEARPEDAAHAFNTSLVFSPDGELAALYRKIHLYETHHKGKKIAESDYQHPGNPDDIVTVETPWGGMGLSICYDLRFADLYQHQVRHQNACLLTVPSAFVSQTGKDHWEILLRSRAIETQCFVLAANCLSDEESHLPECFGRSMIIDPWGTVLAQMHDSEGYILADLDFELQHKIRSSQPVLKHAR
ncbi:MAG: carbon-nitrogen hydrolase family protein [Candidatus Sericytochromatia bacterium]